MGQIVADSTALTLRARGDARQVEQLAAVIVDATEQYQRDAVHRGLYKFDLGEVILATVLLGATALCWFWARWRLQAALGAILAGLVVFLKPFIWPLISTWGEPHPYGLTSETHLYFLLSGLGLVALGIILIVRWKILRDREKVFGPRV